MNAAIRVVARLFPEHYASSSIHSESGSKYVRIGRGFAKIEQYEEEVEQTQKGKSFFASLPKLALGPFRKKRPTVENITAPSRKEDDIRSWVDTQTGQRIAISPPVDVDQVQVPVAAGVETQPVSGGAEDIAEEDEQPLPPPPKAAPPLPPDTSSSPHSNATELHTASTANPEPLDTPVVIPMIPSLQPLLTYHLYFLSLLIMHLIVLCLICLLIFLLSSMGFRFATP